MQDCPNPSKAVIHVLAGPSLACSSSSCKAHARRCCVWEAAHGHGAWGGRLMSWATLGSTAPSREGLAQCCFCYWPCTMASPGKNSKREPRAVGFTSHLQGLTRWNTNIWYILLLPQTCCWMRGPALQGPSARLRKNKLSRTKQNKTWQFHLGF